MINGKPAALDLCSGRGGWTKGLQAAGWYVIGVNIPDEPWTYQDYPGDELILKDVRELNGADFKGRIELVCASPPCQEFSYSSFPFKKAREKFTAANPPDRSIWDACVRIATEAGVPLILENVSGARKWMGKAQAHYGSFYLWGDVPALLPIGCPRKGFQGNDTKSWGGKGPLNLKRLNGFPGKMDRVKPVYTGKRMVGSKKHKVKFADMPHSSHSSHSSARKLWSAKAAEIPLELATWIGECFHPRQTEPR